MLARILGIKPDLAKRAFYRRDDVSILQRLQSLGTPCEKEVILVYGAHPNMVEYRNPVKLKEVAGMAKAMISNAGIVQPAKRRGNANGKNPGPRQKPKGKKGIHGLKR